MDCLGALLCKVDVDDDKQADGHPFKGTTDGRHNTPISNLLCVRPPYAKIYTSASSISIHFPKPKMKFAAALVLLAASASAWTADKASSRRDVLNKVAGAAAVVAAPGVAGAYSVPDLQYGFDALEPFM